MLHVPEGRARRSAWLCKISPQTAHGVGGNGAQKYWSKGFWPHVAFQLGGAFDLVSPGTRIVWKSMPVDRAITNVYLPGCHTYAACPAWFVDQLWQRPILWHIEQTSERLGQCSAPAMPTRLAGDQRAELPLSLIGLQNGSKCKIQIITNQNRRYNSFCFLTVLLLVLLFAIDWRVKTIRHLFWQFS